jgi:hypothetical protein
MPKTLGSKPRKKKTVSNSKMNTVALLNVLHREYPRIPKSTLGRMYNDVLESQTFAKDENRSKWDNMNSAQKKRAVWDVMGDINPRDGLQAHYDVDRHTYDVNKLLNNLVKTVNTQYPFTGAGTLIPMKTDRDIALDKHLAALKAR